VSFVELEPCQTRPKARCIAHRVQKNATCRKCNMLFFYNYHIYIVAARLHVGPCERHQLQSRRR
jgi:hypothetical protein